MSIVAFRRRRLEAIFNLPRNSQGGELLDRDLTFLTFLHQFINHKCDSFSGTCFRPGKIWRTIDFCFISVQEANAPRMSTSWNWFSMWTFQFIPKDDSWWKCSSFPSQNICLFYFNFSICKHYVDCCVMFSLHNEFNNASILSLIWLVIGVIFRLCNCEECKHFCIKLFTKSWKVQVMKS